MGARFSPSLANRYMTWWEEFVFSDNNRFHGNIIWYSRYIDDILIMWDGDVVSVPGFVIYLNNKNLNLAFTFKTNKNRISFFNLELVGDPITNKVVTSTYKKQTDGITILHASSCHPVHTIRSIPVGELRCTMRACSDSPKFLQ